MIRIQSLLAALVVGLAFSSTAFAQEADKKTERLWKAKCSSCHGMDGKAATKKGQELKIEDMTSAEFQKKYSDADLKRTILEGLNGVVRDGRKVDMDGFKDELSPEQVDALLKYTRAFGGK